MSIVDCNLQSQYTPNDPTTIYLSIGHYRSSNGALNTKRKFKKIKIINTNKYFNLLHRNVCEYVSAKQAVTQYDYIINNIFCIIRKLQNET